MDPMGSYGYVCEYVATMVEGHVYIFAAVECVRAKISQKKCRSECSFFKSIDFVEIPGLVNIQKTMENHHFQWVNPLFLWPFSIANCEFTRGYTCLIRHRFH